MLVVAAGNLDHKERDETGGSAGLLGSASRAARPERHTSTRRGPAADSSRAPRKNWRSCTCWSAAGLPDADERGRYALHVLNALLGGTMSSRLFQKIREERGLAYSVYSAVNGFIDSGFLAVYAGTSPRKGGEVVRLITEELVDLRDNGPTDQELRVAKEHLKGSLMLALESTSSRMSNLARQEIYQKRQRSLAATLAGVEAVTRDRAQRMAREMTRSAEIGLAAVGRVGQLKLPQGALEL